MCIRDRIRTAHGDAKLVGNLDIYIVPLNDPYQGLLQGGADSMVNWAVVSSSIICAMRDTGHGVAFRCCISQDIIRFVGCHFVDDATQFDMVYAGDLQRLMLKSQKALDDLEGFAKSTGQAINPKKLFWWLVHFKWKGGIWNLSKIGAVSYTHLTLPTIYSV